jgi:hypothetical protein
VPFNVPCALEYLPTICCHREGSAPLNKCDIYKSFYLIIPLITPSKYRPNPIIRALLLRLHLISITRSYSVTLCVITKLRKATISFVLPACLSVRPSVRMEKLGSTTRMFMKFPIAVFLESFSRKFNPPKTDKNNGHFTWRPIQICSYLFVE